jgi:lipopolysaccharide export system permease protein
MKLMDRYLLKETFVPFLIGAVSAIMLLTGGLLYENGRVLFDRGVTLAAVGQLVLYRLPFLVVIAAPVAIAVGTAMAVTRMARDQEILVMRMAGVSVWRILIPYMLLGFAAFGATYWFQENVVPQSGNRFKKLLFQVAMMQSTPRFTANEVVTVEDWKFILGLVEKVSDNVYDVTDMTAIRTVGLKETKIFRAEKARYDNGVWRLTNAKVWHFRQGKDMEYLEGETGRIDKRVPLQDIVSPLLPDEMTRAELREDIERSRAIGRPSLEKEVQYHTKLSIPFACVIFAIFGPVFSLAFSRSGGFTGILLSVFLVFAHINGLLLFTKVLGEQGIVSPLVAAWGPNIIFLIAALVAARRIE